jgi:hypothetical protein
VLGKVAFLKLILYIIIEYFFNKKYIFIIYKQMSLRSLYQDNLKSYANVKCNDLDMAGDIELDGDVQVDGELTVDGTINANNGLQAVGQNILADSFTAVTGFAVGPNLLAPQEVGTHTTNWIGPFTVAGNIDYVKEGDWVTLDFPTVTGTSTVTSQITAQTPLPASLWPDAEVMNDVIITRDNSSLLFGRVTISNVDGSITIGTGPTGASFLNMNNAGFESFTIRYKSA